MSLQEFAVRYGKEGEWSKPIEEFILAAPEFAGDKEIAARIGRMVGDMDSVIREEVLRL